MEGENESTPMTPQKSSPGHDDSGISSPGQTPSGQTPSSPGPVQTHNNGESLTRKRLEFTPESPENSPRKNGVSTEEEALDPSSLLTQPPARTSKNTWAAQIKERWKGVLIALLAISFVISSAINVWLAVCCHNKCKDHDMKHQVAQKNQELQFCASLLPCPKNWVWINGACYYFSKQKKNWDKSQEFCTSYNGTLAIILDQHTLDTIRHYKTKDNPWVGLRKIDNVWRWFNSVLFSNLLLPLAQDHPGLYCAYLNEKEYGVLDCTSERNWICTRNSSFSMADIPALG